MGGWKFSLSGSSQRPGEAEGSLTLDVQGRAASSPDNDGTSQYCQMGWVRQARREGVGMYEPVVEPPQVQNRLQPGGYGPDHSARFGGFPAGATSKPIDWVGGEAMMNACGVVMAMLSGKSWAPHSSNGSW